MRSELTLSQRRPVGNGGAVIVSVPGRTAYSLANASRRVRSVDSQSMPLVSAHLGHWYASLLYVAPVAVIVVVLAVQSRRDRAHDAERGRSGRADGDDDRR